MRNEPAPNLNRVSLGALRAVETVARLGSLRAAATELGVTPGAVSQQILKAEAQLGRHLFNRSPAGLVPTDIGKKSAALLKDGFRALEQAVALSTSPDDVLTISVAPVFASRWLVPRLPELEAESDPLRVNVDATARYVDPGYSGIDACLRVARKSEIASLGADLTAVWLADQHVFPICAPNIAENIHAVSDILCVPTITDRHTTLDWNIWLNRVGLHKDQMRPGTTYSDASLCIDATIAGGGIFLAWDMLAVDALSSSKVVAPFGDIVASGLSYWLVAQKRPNHPRRLQQLEAWLKTTIAGSLMVES